MCMEIKKLYLSRKDKLKSAHKLLMHTPVCKNIWKENQEAYSNLKTDSANLTCNVTGRLACLHCQPAWVWAETLKLFPLSWITQQQPKWVYSDLCHGMRWFQTDQSNLVLFWASQGMGHGSNTSARVQVSLVLCTITSAWSQPKTCAITYLIWHTLSLVTVYCTSSDT